MTLLLCLFAACFCVVAFLLQCQLCFLCASGRVGLAHSSRLLLLTELDVMARPRPPTQLLHGLITHVGKNGVIADWREGQRALRKIVQPASIHLEVWTRVEGAGATLEGQKNWRSQNQNRCPLEVLQPKQKLGDPWPKHHRPKKKNYWHLGERLR